MSKIPAGAKGLLFIALLLPLLSLSQTSLITGKVVSTKGANSGLPLSTMTLGADTTCTVHFSYTDYMNGPLVKYAGNNSRGLEQILMQKYLAYFPNTGLEAYYQWRRIGVPGFLQGPDQSGYGNGGNIPLRFQYPLDEVNSNSINYQAAVRSQYNGTDDINEKMWLLQ